VCHVRINDSVCMMLTSPGVLASLPDDNSDKDDNDNDDSQQENTEHNDDPHRSSNCSSSSEHNALEALYLCAI